MLEITVIGQVIDRPKVVRVEGRDRLLFTVRAENSPRDKTRSSFDFRVLAGSRSLLDRLSVGTEIFVTGLLSLGRENSGGRGRPDAEIHAMVLCVMDRRWQEDTVMELAGRTIPLQSI